MSPKATEGVGTTGRDLLRQMKVGALCAAPPLWPAGHLPLKGGDRCSSGEPQLILAVFAGSAGRASFA